MKEFLDEVNSLILEYPEHRGTLEEILDMCLKDMEEGDSKKEAIFRARQYLYALIKEDK